MSSDAVLSRYHGFSDVVIATGHVTDAAGRSLPRFPESRVDAVAARLAELFVDWELGPESLVICGGARGGDLLAARAARRRGATVWVLLAHEARRFVDTSVAGAEPGWVEEYWHLLARSPSWSLPFDAAVDEGDEVYAATNSWMIEVARTQAGARGIDMVAVWNGRGAEGAGGTADMVAQVQRAAGRVAIIDPLG